MLWPSCTQTAGISLGVVVKCSKGTNRYIYRLHLFDDWIDNLNMFMDFIHVSLSFANYMTIHPVWLSLPARDAGKFDCLLIEPHSYHNDNGASLLGHC